jgi:phosphoglycolate phosphatase
MRYTYIKLEQTDRRDKMSYRAYIFDYDYTLACSEQAILMCFRHIFDVFGYPNITDWEIKQTIGMPLVDAIGKLSGETDRNIVQKMLKTFHDKADEVMTPYTVLYPPVVPMLEKLKANGALVGIVSNKLRKRISDMMQESGLSEQIDAIIGPEDFAKYKPDPEGLFLAMEKLRVSKEETVYIGDSMIDALTAKNAGVDFAAVLAGTTTLEAFSKEPHVKIMQDLSELLN